MRALVVADDFRDDVRAAIDGMPEEVKRLLADKLLGIYFVHGLDSSAVTDVVLNRHGEAIGAVVAMDPKAFMQRSANDWISWKENTPFLPSPTMTIAAKIAEPGRDSRMAAIQFLLLHEFGHVVCVGEAAVPDWWLDAQQLKTEDDAYSFLAIDWQVTEHAGDRKIVPRPHQDFTRRDEVVYYGDRPLSADQIVPLYTGLQGSNFATLYAATSVYDDFAETFATYVHSVLMNRRYEISICRAGTEVMRIDDFWVRPCSAEKRRYMQDFLATERPHRPLRRPAAALLSDMATLAPGPADDTGQAAFMGLAPFLRLDLAGIDLLPIAQDLLAQAQCHSIDANHWMNLSTAMFCIGQRDLALTVQAQALAMQRHYSLAALRQPAKLKLLILAVPGDLAANVPLDCLLEDCDIDLEFCYLALTQASLPALPDHDVLFVGIGIGNETTSLLAMLEGALATWPQAVINRPTRIPNLDRNAASTLLHDAPGVCIPPTLRVTRAALAEIAQSGNGIEAACAGCRYPLIVRPLGSQAGRDLETINSPQAIPAYLARVDDADFFVSNFIDYSGDDGLFRKFRIVLIDGEAFACHMAVSSHWMVHYVNADMYKEAARRDEEAAFMANFDSFVWRHDAALTAIFNRTGLDYLGIDCAETRDGKLLVFEIDHAMVVHAMDPEEMFPYKQERMHRIRDAFRDMLVCRAADAASVWKPRRERAAR